MRKDFESLTGVLATLKNNSDLKASRQDFVNVRSEFRRSDQAFDRIRKTGLRFLGMLHVGLKAYDPQTAIGSQELLQQMADGGKALGAERLIVSGGSTVHPLALRAKADGLVRIAKYCKDIGLGCAYHSHDYDFQDGGTQINGLVTMTDPVVHFVLDAGENRVDFFAKNWRRIDGIHLPLGQAESDWEPLAKAIAASQWRGWLVVANDSGKGGKRVRRERLCAASFAFRRPFLSTSAKFPRATLRCPSAIRFPSG